MYDINTEHSSSTTTHYIHRASTKVCVEKFFLRKKQIFVRNCRMLLLSAGYCCGSLLSCFLALFIYFSHCSPCPNELLPRYVPGTYIYIYIKHCCIFAYMCKCISCAHHTWCVLYVSMYYTYRIIYVLICSGVPGGCGWAVHTPTLADCCRLKNFNLTSCRVRPHFQNGHNILLYVCHSRGVPR